jgi:transcriptional regulator with PAS, ATPase and Fis domain
MTHETDRSLDHFTTADLPMEQCLERAAAAAVTDLPILILGESGTGKTVLARAIHNTSRRSRAAFVAFNAAALSDTLLDSQLFGHNRGAFTGAQRQVRGKFELAHGGTLFIDEIADMTPAAQAKILRAVEYGEFERLGSDTLRRADVRLMSATHLPLGRYLEENQFRKDLFYRISGITICLPPLRDRPNDLRALVLSELAAAAEEQDKPGLRLHPEALDALLGHAWPGNLRELKRVIHTAAALTTGKVVNLDTILLHPAGDGAAGGSGPGRSGDANGNGREPAYDPGAADLSLRSVQLRHIRSVIERMGGNKRRAARALGLSRSTLDRKLAADPF